MMLRSKILPSTRQRVVAVVGLLAVSAAVLASVFAAPTETNTDTAQGPEVGESRATKAQVVRASSGLAILPNEGLQDWVSYADYVVSASVIDERRGGLSSEELEAGEGLAIRMVRLKVDAIIWSAESAAKPPPEQLQVPAGGWLVKSDSPERRLVIGDSVDFLEGHRYLLPIFLDPALATDYQVLSSPSVLPFDGDRAGSGEEIFTADGRAVTDGGDSQVQSRRALWGMSPPEVQSVLGATAPDPIAHKYRHLAATARYQAVLRERPGPSPEPADAERTSEESTGP